MTKTELKLYVGENGLLLTPIELPGLTYTLKYRLEAEDGKMLTKDGKHFRKIATVAANDVDNWSEVEGQE